MSEQIPQPVNSQMIQIKDSTLAIISLIAGITSWMIFPLIGAIAAVITGHLAKKEIRESAGMLKGSGMATAGLILGYVQIGVVLLGACLLIFLAPSISTIFTDISNNLR